MDIYEISSINLPVAVGFAVGFAVDVAVEFRFGAAEEAGSKTDTEAKPV